MRLELILLELLPHHPGAIELIQVLQKLPQYIVIVSPDYNELTGWPTLLYTCLSGTYTDNYSAVDQGAVSI